MIILKTHCDFEKFVIETSEAKNAEDLFSILIKSLEYIGYDRVIFSIVNDRDLTLEGRALGIFHNYPEDWQRYYLEKKYERIDPVIKYGAVASRPFRWEDLINKMKLSQKQVNFFHQGQEAGLWNGVAIPIRGNRAQLSGIALASSQKIDACDRRLDMINAYCQQFFLCYKRMFAKDPIPLDLSGDVLSPKESYICGIVSRTISSGSAFFSNLLNWFFILCKF